MELGDLLSDKSTYFFKTESEFFVLPFESGKQEESKEVTKKASKKEKVKFFDTVVKISPSLELSLLECQTASKTSKLPEKRTNYAAFFEQKSLFLQGGQQE